MTPKDSIQQLVSRGTSLYQQAQQSLMHSLPRKTKDGLVTMGLQAFLPRGTRTLARGVLDSIGDQQAANLRADWQRAANDFINQCISSVGTISFQTQRLTTRGNSSLLIRKFNRARRIKSPVRSIEVSLNILQEIHNLDLLWNSDILAELAHRKKEEEAEREHKKELKAISPNLVRAAGAVDILNRFTIGNLLTQYPTARTSVLGALDRLNSCDPDALRHCLSSCRSAIEDLIVSLGGDADWHQALPRILPSDTDQRQVKQVHHFISARGLHTGHKPSHHDAEYCLRLTVATIEFILSFR
jgi:hypothetical protein